MRLAPTLNWVLASDPPAALDSRLVPLLDAVARSGSLSAAVVACGVSYRAAWGLLRDYEARLGAPLVTLERGRGARECYLPSAWKSGVPPKEPVCSRRGLRDSASPPATTSRSRPCVTACPATPASRWR